MNYDVVEVVIDKTVRTLRLKDWLYDVEEWVEDIADALKLIGAAKIYEDRTFTLTLNGRMAKLPLGLQHIKSISTGHKYKEQGSFIVIDAPNGSTIELTGQFMPMDTRGFVLVPDSAEVREAIMWYLIRILALRGDVKHISFERADAEWDWRCGSARATLNVISMQTANQIHINYTRLLPLRNQHEIGYGDLDTNNNLNREKNKDSL